MRTDKLFARILRRFADSMSAPKEFANLAEYYLEEFSAIVVAPLKEISLNRLEFILGLRTRGGTRDIALRDFSAQIDSLLKQPEMIYSMTARRFEEILAFALSKKGYEEVQLTAQTRDGGYDIAAVRNGVTRQRLIFECKRFSSSRKVGRPLLDAPTRSAGHGTGQSGRSGDYEFLLEGCFEAINQGAVAAPRLGHP